MILPVVPDEPYVMLMASLPALGPLLSHKEPPISRVRLEARLKALTPKDAAEVARIQGILSWSRLALDEDESAYLARAEEVVLSLRSETLRSAMRARLELRTLVAALRRRHAGEDVPAPDSLWGFGGRLGRIRDNWALPDFGLGRSVPWLAAAKDMLDRGDTVGLERTVLEAAWSSLARHQGEHAFDFEAVVLYLLRWSLVDRWTRYDDEAAAERFSALLDAAFDDTRDQAIPDAA